MIIRSIAATGALLLSMVFAAHGRTSQEEFEALLDRSSEYVDSLEKQLAVVVWRESYEQTDSVPKRFGASGSQFTSKERRRLDSEMLFVWVDANATWLAVRDVMNVDGKSVRRRLPAVLGQKQIRVRDLRALSDENGRYNLGPIQRNFNEPMLAMLFVDARYRPRFEFSDGGSDTIGGVAVRTIHFVDVKSPTLIRTINRDVQTSGDIYVSPSDGRVLRTSLEVAQNPMRGHIVVNYRLSEKLGVLVPSEMTERYSFVGLPPDQNITCTARYSDFRRFETGGRLILR